MHVLNLPNTLTITRIVLIPVFTTLIVYKMYDYALYVFVIAALTDALDGLLARLRNQKTPLGTFLDPLADKFLIVTSFILFSFYGWVPEWLTIIVISRDIIVVIGWVLLYFITHTLKVEPSMPGKLSIGLQLILLCYVLLDINYGFIPAIKGILIWATASLAILSALHYIYRGLKLTGEK